MGPWHMLMKRHTTGWWPLQSLMVDSCWRGPRATICTLPVSCISRKSALVTRVYRSVEVKAEEKVDMERAMSPCMVCRAASSTNVSRTSGDSGATTTSNRA